MPLSRVLVTGLLGLSLFTVGCTGEIDEKPAAVVAPPAPAPAPAPEPAADPAEGATRLAVDVAGSTFAWTGAKVTKAHEGGFTEFKGELLVKDGAPVGTDFSVQVASLFTDSEKLVSHLKSADFFDVEKYGEASFTSRDIKLGADANSFVVTGELDMHGVKNTISFPATITMGADKATTTAEFSINRQDWGISYPGKPDDLIKDQVAIKLNLSFPMPSAAAEPGPAGSSTPPAAQPAGPAGPTKAEGSATGGATEGGPKKGAGEAHTASEPGKATEGGEKKGAGGAAAPEGGKATEGGTKKK